MNRNLSPLILTPGPVRVPDFVMEAIGQVVIHQRSTAFEEFFQELQDDLRYLFQTRHPVIAMAGTGTFGMEAVIYSLFKPGDRVVVVDFGKFSNRWVRFSRQLGLKVNAVETTWGEMPSVEEVLAEVKAHNNVRGVVLTHCETSTGVCIDLEEMAHALRRHDPDLLIVVDAMSTVGAVPFYFDAWDLDAAVTASQKALMNPAGTVFAALSPRAAACLSPEDDGDCFYLYPYYEKLQRNSFPFTPPTQLLFGVRAALRHIRTTGLPRLWNHTHELSQHFKKGILELGGKLLPDATGDPVTAFYFPERDHRQVASKLYGDHLIEVSGGQGELKGKILRVAHFGAIALEDMDKCLAGLKAVLEITGGLQAEVIRYKS